MNKSSGNSDGILMVNLKKKIMTFSDIIDLPPSDCSNSTRGINFLSPIDLSKKFVKKVSEILNSTFLLADADEDDERSPKSVS